MRVLAIIAASSVALCSTAAAASPANQTTRPAAVAAAAQVSASNLATQTDEQGKLLLMLDASGSMKAKDPSGLTKIEAAKKALTGVVGALPATAQVGLRVYGARVDGKGKPTPAACADTRLVAPIAPLDKARLTSTIGAIQALGETPIAHSLEESMKDLGPDGKRNIVLVSDGEESCVPDPCPVVKKLTANGINLQIDTVGFGVDAKARAQLRCIADAGNGTYYDARDADALGTSLTKLSQRALRPFTVSGKPIEGAYETIDGAPELAPGQYVDTFGGSGREKARTTGGFETTLYYRIKRTIPGSTPRISVTSRPPGRDATVAVEGWHLYLRTEDNKVCGQASELIRSETGRSEIVSASVSSIPKDPRLGEAGPDECATTDTLILSTARSGNGGPAPTEIRYVEEPPVTNESQLPGAVTSIDPKAASPASASGPTVIGGASFSDSERLTPGTYVTSVIPGEETFFRVAVDWGQSAVISVDGPADPSLYDRGLRDRLHLYGHVLSPDRIPVDTWDGLESLWVYEAENNARSMVNVIPAVKYRNRWSKVAAGFSLAGDYYVSVGMTTEHGGKNLAGVPIPIKFSIAVNGTTSGQPAYAGTAPSAQASRTADGVTNGSPTPDAAGSTRPSGDAESATPVALWGGLGALVLLGGAATAYAMRRRHSHADTTTGPIA